LSDEPSKPDLEDSIDKLDKAIAGDRSEDNIDALKQAIDTSWPEIQLHLYQQGAKEDDDTKYDVSYDGKRQLPLGFDSWWLKDFIRDDVLMELPGVVIMNTKPWHIGSACISYREAYGIRKGEDCDDCFDERDIESHIAIFPEGQFVAQRISGPSAGNCVGMACTMRTSRPPSAPILPWMEAIGDLRIAKHEADGDWLYGVEMAVHPMYQRHGIGTGLYQARFDLVKRLNLRGWYAVGMLMGYHRYADSMDVSEYGERVIAGDFNDPTVTMQMNRGFRAQGVVADYVDEPAAGDAGVLIVWENPDFDG